MQSSIGAAAARDQTSPAQPPQRRVRLRARAPTKLAIAIAALLIAAPLARAQSQPAPQAPRASSKLARAAQPTRQAPAATFKMTKQQREERAAEDGEDAGPLAALASPEALAALGPFSAERGAWVEYVIHGAGAPDERVRISVLPQVLPDGRYWLELDSATAAGLAVATRLLVHGELAQKRSIERIVVYIAGQAAFELPLAEAHDQLGEGDSPAAPAAAPAAPRPKVTRLAPAQVKVPAGVFKADRIRISAGGATTQLWRAREVPLWGLLRSENPATVAELLGFAHSGAHSLVPSDAAADLDPPPAAQPPDAGPTR